VSKSSGAEPAALICPRCRSGPIEVLCKSPVANVWTLYGCKTCLYAWRSTEPEENTNPDKYPEAFRLKPQDLGKFAIVPTIPALRSG
jgi:vanillate/4-hydroxybenzoate decarboxylase subunit D